ncbi:MAG TPA: pyrroline-5-carboxylate reductase [Armatimonadota bacterium]|nr:pyrroline-5-carboxylate reductase [Armatimonadota bacterium]
MSDARTIAIIGTGRMGTALASGLIATGAAAASIRAFDHDPARLRAVEGLGLTPCADTAAAAAGAALIVIAVKPADVPAALAQVAPSLTAATQTVLSLAAGVTTRALRAALPRDCPAGVVRAMPNTPCVVGEGMAVIAADSPASAKGIAAAREVLAAVGRVIELPEALLDAATGLSGSGPAYAFVFMQALADGGVAAGLPRVVAIELAAQTVLGAARMVLAGEGHPEQLKDAVMSPAGTTAAGVAALEARGLRAAAMEAVVAAWRRARELGAEDP